MNKILNTNKLLHGGDYNPEQWLYDPKTLETDIAYFKKAHINEGSLGIFSWSMLEPQEGVYEFDWMKEIIDRLYENGKKRGDGQRNFQSLYCSSEGEV